jgi:hypothetical protein
VIGRQRVEQRRIDIIADTEGEQPGVGRQGRADILHQ